MSCCLPPSVFQDDSGFVPSSRDINTTAPLAGGGPLSSDLTLSITQASGSTNGFLSSIDWTTFNNKVPAARTISTAAPLVGGGDLTANRTLSITQASGSTDGFLSSGDWSTFNGKVSTSRTISTSAPLSGGGDLTGNRTLSITGPTYTQNTGAPSSAALVTAGGTLWRRVYGSVTLQATAANAASWTIDVENAVSSGVYDTVMSLRVNPAAVPLAAQDFGFAFEVQTGRRYRFTKGGLAGTSENINHYSFSDF